MVSRVGNGILKRSGPTNNDTSRLVAGNEGELGNELSLVDVQIGTADTARLYSNTQCYYNRAIGEEVSRGNLP